MRAATLGLLLPLALSCAVQAKSSRPHIMLVVCDDLGFNDVEWAEYSDVPTPNLNNLRGEGRELMQLYSQPKCTPSRAAIMTGRYPFKIGHQTKTVFNRVKNSTLDTKYKLLPAYLKDLGYHTHMVGKWHLGYCKEEATPIFRGFDTHLGSWTNQETRFNQTSQNILDWHWNNKPDWSGQGTHTTHLITNHTEYMLRKHFGNNATKDDPVFFYVTYLVPHTPNEKLDYYLNNTICSQIPETITVKGKTVTNLHRNYCSLVAALDDGIGNITKTMRDLNVFDDFIFIFCSDNGGAMNAGANNYPLRGSKQTIYEGGVRSRALLRAPNFLDDGHKTGPYNGVIHFIDLLPTLISAAKGNSSVLPDDIDGKDLWDQIKKGMPTNRQWMVLNIDSSRKLGALIFKNETHHFKLVYSNATRREPGFRYPDPSPDPQKYVKKGYKREGQAYILYDLANNPREIPPNANKHPFGNATETHKDVFDFMKKRLDEEFEKEVDIIRFSKIKGGKTTKNGHYEPRGC